MAEAQSAIVELEPTPSEARPLPLVDPEIATRPAWTPPPHERWVRLSVFAFACLMFLPNLGGFGLWDPWETHYGAVATNMLETHDWVSPWWGFKEQIGSEPAQGAYFFSKPVFLFWAEAAASSLIGRGEWAMRLPVAVLAILAVYFLYLTMARIWSRRVGVLAAIIMATSPQFFMIARQAQTDMPFVATLTMALSALMLALFGPRIRPGPRRLGAALIALGGFVLLAVMPQLAILVTDLTVELEPTALAEHGGYFAAAVVKEGLAGAILLTGWIHAAVYGALLLIVLGAYGWALRRDLRREGWSDATQDRWVRRGYLILFYVLIAGSTYAKGLLGFMLPGLFILFYLVLSGRWSVLRRVELVRGVLVSLVVGLPWYVAMLCKHGYAYYERFFIHDHFNRLSAGVHQIDSGTFEHFVKWLGIGMFPWAVFVPLTLAWLLRAHTREGTRGQARLFLAVWFLCAFSLFTLSSTKFHHYIFPALPALAALVALFLDRVVDDRGWLGRLTAVVAILFFAVLTVDLHGDPQHIRNLMTYKYDRPLAEDLPLDLDAPVAKGSDTTWAESTFFRHSSPTLRAILTTPAFEYRSWLFGVGVVGLALLLLFLLARTRRMALAGMALLASAMTLWALNYYMPSLTPHWSQKYLFDTYYDTCSRVPLPEEVEEAYTPVLARVGLESVARALRWQPKTVCQEDVVSWRITWRGETYYSYNELQPITKENEQFLPYLEERNHGEPFFVLMERGKAPGFRTKLQRYSDKLRNKGKARWRDIQSWEVEVVNDENLYFQMVKVTPVRG